MTLAEVTRDESVATPYHRLRPRLRDAVNVFAGDVITRDEFIGRFTSYRRPHGETWETRLSKKSAAAAFRDLRREGCLERTGRAWRCVVHGDEFIDSRLERCRAAERRCSGIAGALRSMPEEDRHVFSDEVLIAWFDLGRRTSHEAAALSEIAWGAHDLTKQAWKVLEGRGYRLLKRTSSPGSPKNIVPLRKGRGQGETP